MNNIIHQSANSREFLRKSGALFAGTAVHKYLIAVVMSCLAVTLILANAHAQTPNPFSTAADAKELTEIHLHLHHVLNCLEGSTGRDFKKVADNPCTGKGALQTLPKGSANLVRSQKAIAIARVGVTPHDVPPAHYVAQAVHSILTEDQRR